MEDSDGIRDNEVTETQGESDVSEHDIGNIPTQKHKISTSGNEEWNKQQELRKLTPRQRIEYLESRVKGFRIASAGDGLLRGGFGKLPTGVDNLIQQMKNLSNAMNKFHLVGDNLNVQGSFNKGYTVSRENPCDQQQDNQNPT